METYKITPSGLQEIKKKHIKTILIRQPIIILFIILILWKYGTYTVFDKTELMISASLFILVILYSLYNRIKKLLKVLKSFQIIIAENGITRKIDNVPTISIYFKDIREITKHQEGHYSIKGQKKDDIIFIFSQTERFEEITSFLETLLPVKIEKEKAFTQKYSLIIFVFYLGVMATGFITSNKIILGIDGLLMIGLLFWSYTEMRKLQKNMEKKNKIFFWLGIVIMVMLIIRVISIIIG